MFNGRYTFDSMSVVKDSYVFASEYAVFDWGISTIPRGNIQVCCSTHDARHPLRAIPASKMAVTCKTGYISTRSINLLQQQ